MVLAYLGWSITNALKQMRNATIIDEEVLNECLNEITRIQTKFCHDFPNRDAFGAYDQPYPENLPSKPKIVSRFPKIVSRLGTLQNSSRHCKIVTLILNKSDVQFKLVRDMQTNIKKIVNLDDLVAGHNKRRIIQQVTLFHLSTIFYLVYQ
ncbi:signal recognition particle 54 kDa protein, putative [Medicago truncatula]|uniref:Signal recognition particle 54 kDa protein, putative n=1 Tax=Medicago truncatula TaxID=3880 RepID=G7JGX2_MEDTR|nr:signal recognition particle 54 kDa protein, putative [Medicago truncatula]